MGVISCGRRGCSNIMCHYYMGATGDNICRDCVDELCDYIREHGLSVETAEAFMNNTDTTGGTTLDNESIKDTLGIDET